MRQGWVPAQREAAVPIVRQAHRHPPAHPTVRPMPARPTDRLAHTTPGSHDARLTRTPGSSERERNSRTATDGAQEHRRLPRPQAASQDHKYLLRGAQRLGGAWVVLG